MPAIPARNVYYLLCYAWDWLEARDLIDVAAIKSDRVQDLLGVALAATVSRALRRGLDREYLPFAADTRSPRGKIDLASTISRAMTRDGRLHCVMDDLSHDVLHNQLIAATLRRLAAADIDRELARSLRILCSRFPHVREVLPSSAAFRCVRLHRNILHYRFILHLCQLIVQCLLPEPGGGWQFHDFSTSPQQMGLLFQDFVRNFLLREQSTFSVSAPLVAWDAVDGVDKEWLPQMRTDVCMTARDRCVIIEVKYPQTLFQIGQGARPKLHSGHLYQLLAYLKNAEARGTLYREAVGVLMYASHGQPLDLRYVIAGHPIFVRAIDLAQPWQEIHHAMLEMARDVALCDTRGTDRVAYRVPPQLTLVETRPILECH